MARRARRYVPPQASWKIAVRKIAVAGFDIRARGFKQIGGIPGPQAREAQAPFVDSVERCGAGPRAAAKALHGQHAQAGRNGIAREMIHHVVLAGLRTWTGSAYG